MRGKIANKTGSVGRHGSLRSALTSPLGRPWETVRLPNDVLNRIATVTRVPNPMSLQRRMNAPLGWKSMLVTVLYSRHLGTLELHGSDARQQIKRVARIAEDLAKAVEQLGEAARIHLETTLTKQGPLLFDGEPDEVEWLTLLQSEIRRLAEAARSSGTRPKKKPPHRPRRSFKHDALPLLIEWLYVEIVVKAHGALTLSEDAKTSQLKGTLLEVLEILRPRLMAIANSATTCIFLRR